MLYSERLYTAFACARAVACGFELAHHAAARRSPVPRTPPTQVTASTLLGAYIGSMLGYWSGVTMTATLLVRVAGAGALAGWAAGRAALGGAAALAGGALRGLGPLARLCVAALGSAPCLP